MTIKSIPSSCVPPSFFKPKVLGSVLLTSAMAMGLMACQPANDNHTDAATSDQHEEHANHDHAEEHMAHEEDEHEHEHDEHNENAHENADEKHEDSHDDHSGHDHAGHDHDHASHRTSYNCTPEKDISVMYNHTSSPRMAHLLIDGIEYDLESTNINKDAYNTDYTYISQIGLDDAHGLVWQTSQDSATLKTPDLKDIHDAESQTPVYECHKDS